MDETLLEQTTGAVVASTNILSENIGRFGWLYANGDMLVVVLLGFIWLTSMIWVARDSAARTESSAFQITSILLVTLLTPLVGIPLYLLIRPTGRSYDMNGRRESLIINSIDCLNCGCKNLTSHHFCVFCGEGLNTACKECSKEYPVYYEYCPSCGAPHIKEVVKRKKKKIT